MSISMKIKHVITFVLVIVLVLTVPIGIGTSDNSKNQVFADDGQSYVFDVNLKTTSKIKFYKNGSGDIIAWNGVNILATIPKGNTIVFVGTTDKNSFEFDGTTDGTFDIILSGTSITDCYAYNYSPISAINGAKMNIYLRGDNYLKSTHQENAALYVSSTSAITLSGISGEGTGYLKAETSESCYGAGIGGTGKESLNGANNRIDCGKITIEDGVNITANSHLGAGIGGANGGSGSNITINGGIINASSISGAHIGGGSYGNGKNITINGGDIDVSVGTTYRLAAGIGGGTRGSGTNIKITGGKVKAGSCNGAGIGGGSNGIGSGIEISGGIISASSQFGAGIGGGDGSNGDGILISGGNVTATSRNGAGIGGGNAGNNINITGGIVYAEADNGGAGIGGGVRATGSGIEISGGIVYAEADIGGAAIGGGIKGNSEGIAISGGFVNAKALYYAIGPGANGHNYGISITGGSVVADSNAGFYGIANPRGFDVNEVFKIDIPLGHGMVTGNKDIDILVNGNPSTVYKAKTVSVGASNEHGTSYTYAATVYLPPGTHDVKVDGKRFGKINVTGENNFTILEKRYEPNADNCSVDFPTKLNPNTDYIISVGQDYPTTVREMDSALTPVSWTAGNQSGSITSGTGIVNISQPGKYILNVIFAKYTYDSGTWKNSGETLTKSMNIDVISDNVIDNTPGVVLGEEGIPDTVTKIHTPTKKIYVKKGKSITLPVYAYAGSKRVKSIKWSSSKKSVATVNKNGKIKAKKTGTTTITAKSTNGKKVKVTITVVSKNQKAKKIIINGAPKKMKSGDVKYLSAKITPKKATGIVTWKSSNSSVIKVDKAGRIVAKKPGKAKITAKIGSKKVTKTIKVN